MLMVTKLCSDSDQISIRQQRVDQSGYLEAMELIIKQRYTLSSLPLIYTKPPEPRILLSMLMGE